MSRTTLLGERKEGVDFAGAWVGPWRMSLMTVDSDRSWTRDVIDRIEDALSRASMIADRAPSLLASKKSFEKRTTFCRLMLDLSQRGWWRGLNGGFAPLQGRGEILQLGVFYGHRVKVPVPGRLLFQRSR